MPAPAAVQSTPMQNPKVTAAFGLAAISGAPQGFILESSMQSPGSYKARLRNASGDYVHVVVILDKPNQERAAS